MTNTEYTSLKVDTQHNNSTSIKIKQYRSNNKTNTEYRKPLLALYFNMLKIF